MPKIYFQNTHTGRKYELLAMDKEKGEVTLKGEHSPFVEKYDKERFQRLGYTLVKEEADAEQ